MYSNYKESKEMIWYSVILLAASFAVVFPDEALHPLSDEFIQQINKKQSLWRAVRNFEIDEYELFKVLASGVKKSSTPRVHKKIHDETEDISIPDSFDAREAWPECADIIGLIRDQSKCGSCWGFAAVEAMSDRICIHSNGTRKILVSSQDVLTCGNSGGCNGGDPYEAFRAWKDMGLVTGGLYERTDQGCKSYFLPPCEAHMRNCTDYVQTPDCVEACDDPSLDYQSQKTYGKDLIDIHGKDQMQREILKNGPVAATFRVYSDFANYKSGIYQLTGGDLVGGHAVKIIGWGVENSTKYWLIANSWNEHWGENGYFRILRGFDEVGIESDVTAGMPDFSKF